MNLQNLLKLARFAVTGGGVCLLDLTLIWLFQKVVPALVAVSAAYLLAVTVHFFLNKWWVFQNDRIDYTRQVGRYLVTVLLSWGTTVAIVSLATRLGETNLMVAKLWAIGPTMLAGFSLMKMFVFSSDTKRKAA